MCVEECVPVSSALLVSVVITSGSSVSAGP